MLTEQNMTQAIMQAAIEAAKATIKVVKEADNPVSDARPVLQHLDEASDKSQELCNFEMDKKNIL